MGPLLPSRLFQGLCAVLILLLTCPIDSRANVPADDVSLVKRPFTIGAISQKAKKHIKFATPLADYLASHLSHYGYNKGRVVVVKTAKEMAELLKKGEVDLVSETLFSALELKEQAGAQLLLKRWKNKVGVYSSIVFIRKDSGIASLEDLKGKVIAFEDPESSSGYFLPATMLINKGYELHKLSSLDQPVPKEKIGYVFVKDQLKAANEISISSWVYHSVVDAGAFSNINWNEDEDMPRRFRSDLEILFESELYPRNLLLARPNMDGAEQEAIKQVLKTAETTEKGKKALRRYQKTSKFEELDQDAFDALHIASELKSKIKKPSTSEEK